MQVVNRGNVFILFNLFTKVMQIIELYKQEALIMTVYNPTKPQEFYGLLHNPDYDCDKQYQIEQFELLCFFKDNNVN